MKNSSSASTAQLDLRWRRLWKRLDLEGDGQEPFERLRSAYGDPPRAYHCLRHVAACLVELDGARSSARAPDLVEAALWYHDAIYEPRRSDNEARSAEMASRVLTGHDGDSSLVEAVTALILVTGHDRPPATDDEALIIDVDLAILGKDDEIFDAYEAGIRKEYAHVCDAIFQAKRAAILASFLGRHRIYRTEPFHQRYEERARANLTRSLARLQG